MDLNKEYAAHQHALMRADGSLTIEGRRLHLARATSIAKRIGAFQHGLGAAAACVWSMSQLSPPARSSGNA